jgi:phosphoribosylformylglycinamidine synthase subunit PurQ / glutaminase
MAVPRVCVLRAPGTNCDEETAFAFDASGARADRVHLYRCLQQPDLLRGYQVLCIPGGFSYGDDIGAGVIFGSQLRGHLSEVLGEFLQADKLVLGICNGFQTLVKAGILPDGHQGWQSDGPSRRKITLTWNENGRYTARWVRLKVSSRTNVFLRGIDELDLPIAHAEGRLLVEEASILSRWAEQDQLALQYVPWDTAGDVSGPSWSSNPNGSLADLAGLGDPSGRVLGLMPHPERFLFATQHPHWTRRRLHGHGAGFQLFQNAVAYFG